MRKTVFEMMTPEQREGLRQMMVDEQNGVSYDTDPRSYFINEETAMQVQPAQQPQQPAPQQATQQPAQQPQPQQQQQPQVQNAPQQPQVIQPQAILSDQTWQAYQQNPTAETLKAFYDKLTMVVQKIFGTAQQPTAQAPQGQQPQPQQGAQQPQAQNAQQQPVQESRKPSRRRKGKPRIGVLGGMAARLSEGEATEPRASVSEPKDGNKYDSAYDRNNGGTQSKDFGWDERMRASIFDGGDFTKQPKDMKYGEGYGAPMDNPSGLNQTKFNFTPTDKDTYKREKPSLTALDNPNAMAKTIFTYGKVEVRDADPIPQQTREVSGPEMKVSDGKVSSKGKSENDGSDDVNEGLRHRRMRGYVGDSFSVNEGEELMASLNESHLDAELVRTIVQQFRNDKGGMFDLADFNEWLGDNYPQISADPQAFDELSSTAEDPNFSLDSDFNEEEDEGSDFGDDIEGDGDLGIKDLVDEYIAQYDGDDYDEDDAADWLDDNFDVDVDTREDFLDAVADFYAEDDINESVADEYFPFERAIDELL